MAGQVEVALDGRPVGAVFDGYAEHIEPSSQVEFGVIHIQEGPHRLRFSSVGKNPRAVTRTGERIRHITVGGRTTAWVPTRQH